MKYIKFFAVLIIVFNCKIANAFEYIGSAQAVKSVQIRPELNAKITKIHFNEGSFVNKSENLFTLDTAEFQAEVSLKKAQLALTQAKLDGASKYFSRAKATGTRAISASNLDTAESEMKQAKAAVDEAKANLKIAEIQLDRTKITAPFDGKIGKINFYEGSYVSPENILCEIVQTNPIRILFAMPDKDYLVFKNSNKNYKYELILADGSIFSGNIEKDFEDNVMNSETGSINIWLKINNDKNILIPGALVRVRILENVR